MIACVAMALPIAPATASTLTPVGLIKRQSLFFEGRRRIPMHWTGAHP